MPLGTLISLNMTIVATSLEFQRRGILLGMLPCETHSMPQAAPSITASAIGDKQSLGNGPMNMAIPGEQQVTLATCSTRSTLDVLALKPLAGGLR